MTMDTDKIRALLEQTKDDLLKDTKTDNSLVNINNEGFNHGVYQMFYRVYLAVLQYENNKEG